MKRFLTVLLTLAVLTLVTSCRGMGKTTVQTTPIRVDAGNQNPGGQGENETPGMGKPPVGGDVMGDAQASGSDDYFSYTLQNGGYMIRKRTGATLPDQLVIPSSFNGVPVVAIDSNAFAGAPNVVSVEIPDSVTQIGDDAFPLNTKRIICSADLDLPYELRDQLTSLTLTSGVVSDCAVMFWLEELELGAGVTKIMDRAFYACHNLKKVTIHDGLQEIGENAFEECESLTSIVLPDSVVSIEAWAFTGCESLASVEIGENVSYIGPCAFDGCTKLLGHITVASGNPYFYAKNGTLYTTRGEDLTTELFG